MPSERDGIRDTILRHLYDVHRSARGAKSVAIGIKALWAAMKKHGIKQQDTNSNLDYLVQKGWVREVVEHTKFTTPAGTTQENTKTTYKISEVGIDLLEGNASAYRREEHYSGINITNIQGVTIVGSGNIVNAKLTDLSDALANIEEAIKNSDEVSEEDRLNVIADIGTIQSQLSKPEPKKSIIKEAWSGVETVVTGAGFVELVGKAKDLLLPLIGAG